jgi:hypothetical protein
LKRVDLVMSAFSWHSSIFMLWSWANHSISVSSGFFFSLTTVDITLFCKYHSCQHFNMNYFNWRLNLTEVLIESFENMWELCKLTDIIKW